MAAKSRAAYFRERRKIKKQLVFMIDRERAEEFDRKLQERGKGRTEWMREKIEE